jgi:hypothetical protein
MKKEKGKGIRDLDRKVKSIVGETKKVLGKRIPKDVREIASGILKRHEGIKRRDRKKAEPSNKNVIKDLDRKVNKIIKDINKYNKIVTLKAY